MNELIGTVTRIREKLAWVAPTLLRFTVGVEFLFTGWGKLRDLDSLTAYFTELGIPAARLQAPMVAGIEFVGGIMLILGLFSRVAALPLIATMMVAILTAQRANIHEVADLVSLIEFAYIAILVAIAVYGSGPVSVDHMIKQRNRKQRGA